MKQYLNLSILLVCLAILNNSNAQVPGVLWQKGINPKNYATGGQLIYDMNKVKSGGYVFVGSDTGYNFNKAKSLDKEAGENPMIIRTDSSGKVVGPPVVLVHMRVRIHR